MKLGDHTLGLLARSWVRLGRDDSAFGMYTRRLEDKWMQGEDSQRCTIKMILLAQAATSGLFFESR
jgi:hypothetical protein